jgi:glycosyltransferase involved in cell wall biosynthesis
VTRLRLAVWSPLPPSTSGVADYVAESLPHLHTRFDVVTVAEEAPPPDVDLDLYHLGNSPAHAFVYRAALRRPGVVVLHDWSLHHLVLHETVERGDVHGYLREMRRAHGEAGGFVGRQVARALGGDLLPALFPLNDRVLERSLGLVALSRQTRDRIARRAPTRDVLHLPHHVSLPLHPVPSRTEARRALGLEDDDVVLTAPGLAPAAKRLDLLIQAAGRLRNEHPRLRVVIAGASDGRLPLADWARPAGMDGCLTVTGRLTLPDFVRHLCAADVVVALRYPSHGEMSGALVRALGVGRVVLVSAGSAAAAEFPEGVVVPVEVGPREGPALHAVLAHLIASPTLRARVEGLARGWVGEHHGLTQTGDVLAEFLERVHAGRAATLARIRAEAAPEDGVFGYLVGEVHAATRDLGLTGLDLGLPALVGPLVGSVR